jgi:hypothetical protein
MATKLALYPQGMGSNQCYLFLMDEFARNSNSYYDINQLYEQFGKLPVEDVIDAGILIKQRNYRVRLAFDVLGSVPGLIMEYVCDEINAFFELLIRLPRPTKCSKYTLRNFLSFLMNFGLVQAFTLPASSTTCVARESDDETERKIDKIYMLSDRLDQRFLYPIDETDGVDELNALVNSGSK